MKRACLVLVLAAVLGACGWVGLELTPEPGFDPDDPALQTIPDDERHAELIIKRAGTRRDFKIPRDMAEGQDLGPLVLALARVRGQLPRRGVAVAGPSDPARPR